MNRVQNLNELFEQAAAEIDTNECQNLELLLPTKCEKQKQKKKKVSPPRQLLPLEEPAARRPHTRSQGKVHIVTCSSSQEESQ